MSPSLRTRLALSVTAAMFLTLAAAGILVYYLMRASLQTEFDAALCGKAGTLISVIEKADVQSEHEDNQNGNDREGEEGGGNKRAGKSQADNGSVGAITLELGQDRLEEFRRSERPEYLQIWLEGYGVLYRSPSLGGQDLKRAPDLAGSPVCRALILPDGRPGRSVTMSFTSTQLNEDSPGHARIVLLLARDTLDMDGTLARLRLWLATVFIGATLASSVALAWMVKTGLRPVESLAAQIAAVGEENLSVRLPGNGVPAELMPVVTRLNDLLAKLQAAFDREKAFSADVAHELRTPLAGLRTTLEVALAKRHVPEEYEDAMRDALAIALQMHTMTENLLELARIERGAAVIHSKQFSVGKLLRECWGAFDAEAVARGLRVSWVLPRESLWMTDPEKFRVIAHNLFANAVAYADRGGTVCIQLEQSENHLKLVVRNSGSRISRDQAPRVLERFWRGDASRSGTEIHCGLGLSLCNRIIQLLNGEIKVASEMGGDFIVTASLPAASNASLIQPPASSASARA